MTPAQTIEAVYAAFGRGDIPEILKHVAPHATWRQPKTLPWGGDYVGPDGAAAFFAKLNETMETTLWRVDEVIEKGDHVFSFGAWSGKSRRTGKEAGGEWMFHWRVEGGKITSYVGFNDSAAILAALS